MPLHVSVSCAKAFAYIKKIEPKWDVFDHFLGNPKDLSYYKSFVYYFKLLNCFSPNFIDLFIVQYYS